MKKIIVLFTLIVIIPFRAFAMKPDLVAETNKIRVQHKLQPLISSPFLDKIAEEECSYRKSHKFNLRLFLNHDRKELTAEQRYIWRLSGFNFEVKRGENQAKMEISMKSATKTFYASKPHRENMLRSDFTNMWTYIVGKFVCEVFSSSLISKEIYLWDLWNK